MRLLEWPKNPGNVVGVYRSYDGINYFSNWCYWLLNVDFENCMCTHVGWDNTKLFSIIRWHEMVFTLDVHCGGSLWTVSAL